MYLLTRQLFRIPDLEIGELRFYIINYELLDKPLTTCRGWRWGSLEEDPVNSIKQYSRDS